MASNVAIKITADTVDVEAKFAVASSRVREFNSELNKLAREASTTGVTDALRQQMLQTSESLLGARNQAAALSQELKSNSEPVMRSFSGAASLAKEAIGALGIGLSIGTVVEFTKGLLDSTAAIGSEARALSISTDALQAYRAAAVQSGGTNEEADAAIRRFTRSIGDAAEVMGPARKAFIDLGISASDLGGGTESALPTVATALLSIEDASQRARLEIELFGKSGQDVERFLEAWADPRIVEAMKNDGLVIDQELIRRAEEFETKWATSWQRFKNEAVVAIGGAAEAIERAESALKAFFDRIPQGVTAEGQPFGGGSATPTDVPSRVSVTPKVAGLGSSNYHWDPAAGAGADKTRQIADEQVSIWQTASQKRIEGEQQANAALLALGNESLEQFRDQAKRLEDARYQAALGGLQARQQIDKGDAVALARDNAEMEVLAVDHANKMAEIDNRYEEEHLRAVKEATDKESALRQAAFNADFAARQEQARLEITQIQQSNAEIEAINRQEVAAKRAAMQEIGAVEGQLVRGIISGRQSAGQIATQLAQTLLEKELTADLMYLTEHEAINLGILASDQATAQEGLLFKLGAWAAEKLGFTVAAAEKTTVAAAEYAATVPMIVGLAGAGGVASMAAAPFPIDLTAPAFGASMAAAAAGFAVLDTGTNYVPANMPALIHEGERVLPKADNAAIIDALNGGGSGSNALHMTNTFHISAGTPADVAGQMKKHMVGVFNDLVRGGYLKLA